MHAAHAVFSFGGAIFKTSPFFITLRGGFIKAYEERGITDVTYCQVCITVFCKSVTIVMIRNRKRVINRTGVERTLLREMQIFFDIIFSYSDSCILVSYFFLLDELVNNLIYVKGFFLLKCESSTVRARFGDLGVC